MHLTFIALMASLATVVIGQQGVECDFNNPDKEQCEYIKPRECYDYRTKRACCMKCMELVNPDLPEECSFGDREQWFLGPNGYSSCADVKDRCDYCATRKSVQWDCCGSCGAYCKLAQQPPNPGEPTKAKATSFKRFLRILQDTLSMDEE